MEFESVMEDVPEVDDDMTSLKHSRPRKRSRQQNRRPTTIKYINEKAPREKVISALTRTVEKKALELINKTHGSVEDVEVFVSISYKMSRSVRAADPIHRRSIIVSSDESIGHILTNIVNRCNAGVITKDDVYCPGEEEYNRFLVRIGFDHLRKSQALPIIDNTRDGILPGLGRSLLLK